MHKVGHICNVNDVLLCNIMSDLGHVVFPAESTIRNEFSIFFHRPGSH